jgi:hypothetical protein
MAAVRAFISQHDVDQIVHEIAIKGKGNDV